MIDDSGDRSGTDRARGPSVAGPVRQTARGHITTWADQAVPVRAPYTPAKLHSRRAGAIAGATDQLAIGAELAVRARKAGLMFTAVAADSAYGDKDGFRGELAEAGLPFVIGPEDRARHVGLRPDAHTPVDAARALDWAGRTMQADWRPVTRTFRGRARREPGGPPMRRCGWSGRTASPAWWWPPPSSRAPCRARPPGTWPPTCPGRRPARGGSPRPAAGLAEVTRIYGIGAGPSRATSRSRTGAGLGRLPGPVRPQRSAATRCWSTCAFSFCWADSFADHPPQHDAASPRAPDPAAEGAARRRTAAAVLAAGAARGPRLAFPLDRAAALVERMVQGAPAPAAASPDQLRRRRLRPASLHPELTNYR